MKLYFIPRTKYNFTPGTTDIDLYNIAKKEGIKLDAVVFKDQLKDLDNRVRNIILNLQSSNHNGSHWTALYINPSAMTAIYSDSFGQLPPSEVISYVRSRKIDILYYNKIQYQELKDGYCGELALSFLAYLQSLES